MRRMPVLVVVLALAASAGSARAQPAAGVLEDTNTLVTFDTAAPGTLTSAVPITGLGAGERMVALDYRWQVAAPSTATPRLFGLTANTVGLNHDVLRLYTVDPGTGAASPLGDPVDLTNAAGSFAMGIDPAADRIRVINNKGTNIRFDPNTGSLAATDTNIPTANQEGLTAMDYDRVAAPPSGDPAGTTAYAIGATNAGLFTLGGINQSPSPDGGTTAIVGTLTGFAVSYVQDLNLDIAPDGTAFATLSSAPSAGPALYTIDLATAAPTQLGSLPAPLVAFAVVPRSVVQVDPAAVATTEGATAQVTVTRSGALSGTATVAFATADGTATSADYTPSSGSVTFGPDETTKQIAVPIADDQADEPAESFTVTLGPPGAPTALGSPVAATVTIAKSDTAAARDRKAPALTLSGVPKSISRTALLKGLRVGARPSERAALRAQLLATDKDVHLSAFNLTLASVSRGLGSGKRTLTLKPKRALVGKPRRSVKLRLLVTATDAAGNRKTVTRTITLKRGR